MAVKKSPKIEAQVVEAIRRLQAIQGSTPREISNYIAQEYNIPTSEIRRHVQLALKRGVIYGILQRIKGGYYTYNQDFLNSQCMSAGDNGTEMCYGRRRRRGAKRRGRRRRRSKRRRRGSRSRRKSRRRKSRRRSSRRRRGRRRRRRDELPNDLAKIELTPVTKKPSKGNTLEEGSTQSNHSTVSDNSGEKQE